MNNNFKINNSDKFNVRHYNVKVVREKINPIRFIINVISYALFILLLLVGVTLLIYVADSKIKEMKGVTTPPKYNAYVVLTGSMIPEILPKDVVVTKKRDAKDLKAGDIITFISSDVRLSNIIVTHRIKNVYYDSTTKKYSFQTKGDNNNTEDFALAEENNIIGQVIFKIPKLGYVQELLASKGGIILIILVPCLAIISYDIVKLFKSIGKKAKKKSSIIVRR